MLSRRCWGDWERGRRARRRQPGLVRGAIVPQTDQPRPRGGMEPGTSPGLRGEELLSSAPIETFSTRPTGSRVLGCAVALLILVVLPIATILWMTAVPGHSWKAP